MSISILFARLATYYTRHGFLATVQRSKLALRRALFSNRQVVFYCDLTSHPSTQKSLPNFLRVERKKNPGEISRQDLDEIVSEWNPTLALRYIEERLGKGASLWLIKSGERMAGYGWTLQGCTIEPHYLPLGYKDVHLFDFYVFPEYRGRGINPFLVDHILSNLTAEAERAFIEAGEWNQAQLASLAKTPFRPLGRATKRTFFRTTVVCWNERERLDRA